MFRWVADEGGDEESSIEASEVLLGTLEGAWDSLVEGLADGTSSRTVGVDDGDEVLSRVVGAFVGDTDG